MPERPVNGKYKLVVLIDDNEIDNLINAKLLEVNNICSTSKAFDDAEQAVAYFRSLKATSDIPDIVILDVNMPLISGFEFIKQFEEFPDYIKNHTRIVMLSSSLNPDDRKVALSSPYVHSFLIKPLTKESLKSLK